MSFKITLFKRISKGSTEVQLFPSTQLLCQLWVSQLYLDSHYYEAFHTHISTEVDGGGVAMTCHLSIAVSMDNYTAKCPNEAPFLHGS